MKKFVFSKTVFVDPKHENDEEFDLLNTVISNLNKVGEDNNLLVELQISALFKPLTLENYKLCHSITAIYYKEV